MLWKLLAAMVLVAAAVGVVVHQAVTSTAMFDIADALSEETLGGTVAIQGAVTYAKDNHFEVTDDTGTARLSTCPLWYLRIDLHEGDQVTVIGQVLKTATKTGEYDVVLSAYKIIHGDRVINVRDKPGKPPWAPHGPAH